MNWIGSSWPIGEQVVPSLSIAVYAHAVIIKHHLMIFKFIFTFVACFDLSQVWHLAAFFEGALWFAAVSLTTHVFMAQLKTITQLRQLLTVIEVLIPIRSR